MEVDKETQLMAFKEKVIDRYKARGKHANHVLLTITFPVSLLVSQLRVATASSSL
jgi:hypothetical protein